MELVTDTLTAIVYAQQKSPHALFVVPNRHGATRFFCCKSLREPAPNLAVGWHRISNLDSMLRSSTNFRFYNSPAEYVDKNFKPKSKASKLRCTGCGKRLREHK